ncbi:MAG: MBL fold metallo-hydrolase [Treponema sp.]|jgi:glyoxylase-like metal-dependent hydrolase (beta-lactamase superfamily II)|nr:MBL fold metallo-hydrolase [Treponema sp.]
MDGTLTTKKLDDTICIFNEASQNGPQVDAYLVTGTKRAVLIDTLQAETSLYARVKDLCSLPLDVLLTHGHWDHAGVSTKDFIAAGCDVYIDERDIPILTPDLKSAAYKPLRDGMIFDLGGYRLETISVPGHTPGSAVFLEREKQHLYTGDAIGAGVYWMHIPNTLSLRELQRSLKRLHEKVKNLDQLLIHPGHRNQAPVQLHHDFLLDTILATNKIISGEWVGKDKVTRLSSGIDVPCKTISYNLIRDYCYNPNNI